MVHRPPTLKPARSRSIGGTGFLLLLAALECLWFAAFATEPLPNVEAVSKGQPLSRMSLLVRGLPEIVPGVRFRESYLGVALANLSHVEYLPQRIPIVAAAGFILISILALGSLVLRALRIRGQFDRWERITIGFGLGTTTLGLAALIIGRLGLLHPWTTRSALVVPVAIEVLLRWIERRRGSGPPDFVPWPGLKTSLGFAAATGPFLLIMFLGAMLPCIDFDALEYHLQAPKEYFLDGKIAFLPHNVYASMPFSVEMLHLIGMEVVDDWWLGALVGQLLVASFAPATAATIVLTARRIGPPRVAWVAGVVYLTTPWVYRMAVLPYVEGPLCYYHAALVWMWVRPWDSSPNPEVTDRTQSPADPKPVQVQSILLGLLAGGAMAIKYPALISAVIPALAWIGATAWRSRSWRVAAGFAIGLAVVIGPWLAKNVIDTGNPVYPLGYAILGGRNWSPERDAKWSAAHGPKPVEGAAFARSVKDVAGRSDWQSPLFVALIPLALIATVRRKIVLGIGGYCAYLFLTWWFFTHRLDRFWLPMLPPLAVLAGIGSDWSRSRAWTWLLAAVLATGIGSNLVFDSTALAGLNEWTGDLRKLRRSIPSLLNPALTRIDETLPGNARALLVGQAAVFHWNHRVLYNTVFDDDRFEALARGKSPEEIREALNRLGVTHILVDWSEIRRYRSPGNYGFTSFVTPEVFDRLVEAGVLSAARHSSDPEADLYEVAPARAGPVPREGPAWKR